jgi:RND family efflux transporter MFP subunit
MKRGIILLTALIAASCAADPHEDLAVPAAVSVHTAHARVEGLAEAFEAGGTIRARTTAVLSSRVMSSILQVTVKPGDRVRSGQVLVRLDARQFDAARAGADAALAAALEGANAARADSEGAAAALTLARASHERIATLRERDAATPAEIDAAVAGLRGAEARLKAAEARRAEMAGAIEAARASARASVVDASYATLLSPFDGLVVSKAAEPGSLAVPGVPLITIEDVRQFRLEVGIDAANTAGVALGLRVPVTLAGGATIEGVIEEIAPAVDAAHAYTVKVALPPAAGLRSGLFARARFRGVETPRVVIPAVALVRRGQLTLVFIDDKGVARLRYVHAGAASADVVPVLSGLSADERVVLNPPAGLADGTRISPATEPSTGGPR